MSGPIVVLIAVSLAFAWSMGAHYTGAVMGMPYSVHAIRLWPALGGIALLTVIGATLASHGVQQTVGLRIIDPARIDARMATIIVLGAFALTTVYTYYKVPTSTIQILIFCVVGTGVAAGAPVHWATILRLAVTWVLAPPAACALGYIATRLLDAVVPPEAGAVPDDPNQGLALIPSLLILMGLAASFVLGANDVSNAVGIWTAVHVGTATVAGLAGGLAMGIGALTWGRRILDRVAFDIVIMDRTMATAAQGVQAVVVFLAVTQGLFTSMNQALVGAMAGTGLARGRQTVKRSVLLGIFKGWAISPVTGFSLCFILDKLMAATIGS
ncbi:MAG TPA: inorganic phosphate transporter [Chloroflexota bacterium]|nr:inorganic phosphate transporter [Chloroflexota bacterium]